MKKYTFKKSSRDYPDRLTQLPQPPKSITTIGAKLSTLLEKPTLGVVGSRKATPYGKATTEKLVSSAVNKGITTVSGLALGIDSIAHRSTIEAGGMTIAVLPSGINQIYPASHRSLAKQIIDKDGQLLSEYADDFRPRRESFIQRNRIIAALSDVLLITEAAEKSGSLHTARFALELGKTVVAVPGNLNSPTSVGTNNLIKSGAILVTSPEDIFDALGIDSSSVNQQLALGDTAEESIVIKLIQSGLTSGDEVLHESKLPVDIFQQTLTMLEIKGIVGPLGNNHWRLK